jgi:hypothetical protein
MSNKTRYIFLLALFVPLTVWLILSPVMLHDFYVHLSINDLVDLSKTLIQSVGILVGLLITASFFYVGKHDELIIRIFSRANELYSKQEKIRKGITSIEKSVQECKTELSKLKVNLTKPNLSTKEELEKDLLEVQELNNKYSQAIEEFKNSEIDSLITDAEKSNGWIIAILATDLVLFLASIMMAILAYAYKNYALLVGSLDLIVFGMTLMFAVWYIFYNGSRITRHLFKVILLIKSDLDMGYIDIEASKKKLENILSAIIALRKA